MTRSTEEVGRCLELRAAGTSVPEISRLTGIPRPTVNDWVAGRIPRLGSHRRSACTRCGSPPHGFDQLPSEYVYLLGLYLGDGAISRHPRAFRLRLSLDRRYPGIITEAGNAIRATTPRNKVCHVERPGCVEVSAYSKAWPCLFPQHGPGKKHLRRIWLADWQRSLLDRDPRPLLRGLIHSDGCRFMNTGRGWRYPRYSFRNLSPDILSIFTDACDLLGLRWTAGNHVVYVSRKADVETMDRFVGPKT